MERISLMHACVLALAQLKPRAETLQFGVRITNPYDRLILFRRKTNA